MRCSQCQTENREGRRFCAKCAAPLALVCASCGFSNDPGDEFCGGCAVSLLARPAVAPRKFESPRAYTPKHLAEKILTSKAALEGERKQVTVLFADLKGSMELLADRDPEEARRILDPVLERMMEAVHRYEGTVNQVMGDGIMALFGAPLAHEDHAVRACYAALRMQESVKKYADEVRRSHAAVVKIRVGLNSGEVVVRAIGNDLNIDYTAVGQTTHLAARMEQLADPGAIVITPDTLALAEGYVEVKSLGPVPVKGLAGAVEVYEVTAPTMARTRLQASARRGLTRFVGRDAELAQLRRAQQLAGEGRGQVAAIVGEAGVGKSRLVLELTHSHRVQGWLTLASTSVSYGRATSWLPVIDLLKDYFKIQVREDHRAMREKVTGKLLALDRALEPSLPALLTLLEIPFDPATSAGRADAWSTLDPGQRRRQTLDAVKRLLLREAREQPLLIIFEDLHWIDRETQALLDGLVEHLASARLMLLVNYRPEYRHGWSGKTCYSQHRLDVLPVESAAELLEALLGDDPGLASLKPLLVKRGNPFFLEETVRTLIETKALVGERGQYRLTKPIQTIQVPASVQTILAARIDRLAPEDKRLLQIASVIGKDVPMALLQAIAELPEEELRGGLDRLHAAEFVYETGLYPDIEYTFKHALTHDVTYAGLLQERRRELHGKVVAAIEMLYGDRFGEQVERLAHHALRGELGEKAARYAHQAGIKSAARSANQEAVALFERALEVLGRLDESPQVVSAKLDVRIDLGPALILLTGYGSPEVDAVYQEAERLCVLLDDSSRRFPVVWGQWSTSIMRGDNAGARDQAGRLLVMARERQDLALTLEAHHCFAPTMTSLGDFAAVIEHADAALSIYDPELHHVQSLRYGGHDPGVCVSCNRAASLWLLGRTDEALSTGDAVVKLANGLRHPASCAIAHIFSAWVLWHQGDRSAALAQVSALDALIAAHELSAFAGDARILRALVEISLGDADDPFAIEDVVKRAPIAAMWRRVSYACGLAEAYIGRGLPERALDLLTSLPADGFGEFEIPRLRGEALGALGKQDDAQTEIRRALRKANERGARALELRAALALARLFRTDEDYRTLAGVCAAFSGDAASRDVVAARALLDEHAR